MWSSSIPSTITIPYFKPISLRYDEFWKRYHQNYKIRWEAGGLWWLKKFLMLKENFYATKFTRRDALHLNFAQNVGFRDIFKNSGQQVDLQRLKLCILIKLSSIII
jgi:hypothetical protein